MENLISWTNKRAAKKINNTERRKQKKALWSDISFETMNAFIGCLLTMGVARLPNYRMYWHKDTTLFSIPGIREIIPEQKFKDILSCFCL